MRVDSGVELNGLIDAYDSYNLVVCHRFNRVVVHIALGIFVRLYKRASEKTRLEFDVILHNSEIENEIS